MLVDTTNNDLLYDINKIDKRLMSFIVATEDNNSLHKQKFKKLKEFYLSLKLKKLEDLLNLEKNKNKIEKLQIEINELKTNFRSLL